MKKANLSDLVAETWGSPAGKFKAWGKTLNPHTGSTDAEGKIAKWPFEVELAGIPSGKTMGPFHCHAAQWEFYLVVSGTLTIRDDEGETEMQPGDFCMFGPGENHQLSNKTEKEVTYYCIADNPVTDHCYYPDSKKWSVRVPERKIIQGQKAEYFAGEDEGGGTWVQS
jgi:uncharacterized cupin superfamily protein